MSEKSKLASAFRLTAVSLVAAFSLGACAEISHTRVQNDEALVVMGPAVRNNVTPLNDAYVCYRDKLQASGVNISIGVSDIRDYTGKASDLEGTVVTQGGPLMAYSALGKLAPAIQLRERFDTRVAELELAYIDRRQLGTGQTYVVNGQQVPWVPYFGGTILESDYYLVGGITEVNYNIQSGGAQFSMDLVGPTARTFVLSVALDLRLVNSQSLTVVSTASLQKQVVGYEVEFGIFNFFGTDYLFNFDAGAKNQEPIQLAVRTTLELGILQLLGDVTGVFYEDCVSSYFQDPSVFDHSRKSDSGTTGASLPSETPAGTAEDEVIPSGGPAVAETGDVTQARKVLEAVRESNAEEDPLGTEPADEVVVEEVVEAETATVAKSTATATTLSVATGGSGSQYSAGAGSSGAGSSGTGSSGLGQESVARIEPAAEPTLSGAVGAELSKDISIGLP